VLVIDDEPQIVRALRTILSQNGYQVASAGRGEEGLALAAAAPPDVIILDLGLPDMDGITVCERLREWTRTPIIVLSVRDADADKVAALDKGADDYLTKPFSADELLARLRWRCAMRSGTAAARNRSRGRTDYRRPGPPRSAATAKRCG
jgi:two-component system KDP operon response regulator KdpE